MPQQKQIKFIKGKFTPEAAREVLISLIDQKIQFHAMQNFSSEERFGKPVPGSQKRIQELKAAREKIGLIVEQAIAEHKDLKIESNISIELK